MSRPRCEYGGPPQCMFDPETCARCNPAAPAAEADLRERLLTVLEIAGPLSPSMEKRLGDALMAEISRLVAEAAEARRLRETVARVRALVATADQLSETGNPAVRGWQTPAMRTVVRDLRRALDGTDG